MRFPRFISLFLLLSTLCLRAQSPDGNINGLVLDPSGAVVAEAEIVAVNDLTAVQYATKTNREGMYVLPNLPPGPYRLQVSKVGFNTLIKPDIVVNVQDALAINFTLPVGPLHEVLTIVGGAPLVNTESGSVSTVVDEKYVANMPLNGRSFQDLILLTPGTVTQTPQASPNVSGLGQTGEFSVNGQRPESNYYTVDGVSANIGAAPGASMTSSAGASGSVAAATSLGTTQALVSVDDLQEFRVQTSTYSAEYGRNPGGQFSFETKSGTNEWHGTAYEYLRNGVFDSNDWFTDYLGARPPALRQNDFGAALGGPLHIPGLYNGKDRSFFFFSYEGLRLAQPQAASVNFVPDASLRTTSPPSLQPVLRAFPAPNGPDDAANGIAEFISAWSNPSSLNSTSIRLDHFVHSKLRLFFRFSDTPSHSIARGNGDSGTPSELTSTDYLSRTYTLGATSLLTARLSNEFRLNYSSNSVSNSNVIDSFGDNVPINFVQLAGLPATASQSLSLLYGGYDVSLGQAVVSAVQRQWNLVDTATFSLGRHQIKLGADYRRLTPIATPSNPSDGYLYFAEALVQSNDALAIADTLNPAFPLYVNSSVFAQDQWRVTPRLSLSLGMRWELNPAPGVTRGNKPYTVQGAGPSTWTLAPSGTPLWQTTWYNFAPRLGLADALQVKSNWETVLRGGVGLFYDTGQQLGSVGFQGPGYGSGLNFTPSPFPLPVAEAAPPVVTALPCSSCTVYAFPWHMQLPYTIQWNVTFEQALGRSQALTASYVGSHSSRLLKVSEFSGVAIGNPNAAFLQLYGSGETSDYNALQMQFRRRLTQGLSVLSSYTWSHCIDFGSQDYVFGYQRGNCDFDVRHNVSAAVSYDLPEVGHNGLTRGLLHHWGIDDRFTARSAFPVHLIGNQIPDPATGEMQDQGLDLVPGEPTYLYGANCAAVLESLQDLLPGQACPGGRAINPQAFVIPPTPSRLGDAPRNFTHGFGAWQMDLAVRRDFPVYERLRLQFRAEAFNVFNHPNFGAINPQYCAVGPACTFGQATGTLASTLGVLSPLYQMGGPRSMQFALKVLF
jgi:Carboxypeptidase regulatory-like domain